MLLPNYYDSKGNFIKEVFVGTPERIANDFANKKLSTKQLRDFHTLISRARNKAMLKGIEAARPVLWECQKHAAYQLQRGKIPEFFVKFVNHHISLAEKSEKDLEGFYQHFDSIVCYFPKEKGGSQ